jgi:hypothetical protein
VVFKKRHTNSFKDKWLYNRYRGSRSSLFLVNFKQKPGRVLLQAIALHFERLPSGGGDVFAHDSSKSKAAVGSAVADSRAAAAAAGKDSRAAAVAGSWAGLSTLSTVLAVNALLGLAG